MAPKMRLVRPLTEQKTFTRFPQSHIVFLGGATIGPISLFRDGNNKIRHASADITDSPLFKKLVIDSTEMLRMFSHDGIVIDVSAATEDHHPFPKFRLVEVGEKGCGVAMLERVEYVSGAGVGGGYGIRADKAEKKFGYNFAGGIVYQAPPPPPTPKPVQSLLKPPPTPAPTSSPTKQPAVPELSVPEESQTADRRLTRSFGPAVPIALSEDGIPQPLPKPPTSKIPPNAPPPSLKVSTPPKVLADLYTLSEPQLVALQTSIVEREILPMLSDPDKQKYKHLIQVGPRRSAKEGQKYRNYLKKQFENLIVAYDGAITAHAGPLALAHNRCVGVQWMVSAKTISRLPMIEVVKGGEGV